MIFVLISAGLALLLLGGEALVRGAVGVANRFGMSPLLIGLTLVGFGTSTPELMTSIKAALAGSPGVAVGNIVGSNIANVLLILGVSAIIAPLNSSFSALKRDGGAMLAAALVCAGLGLYGVVTRPIGGVMVIALIGYIAYAYWSERRNAVQVVETQIPLGPAISLTRSVVMVGFGLLSVILGADWLVRGAIALAREAGISEPIIGLTIVAVGTSLPELATSVVAAFRRNSDIAIGNIVGSNIYNVFGILGATALVEPVLYPDRIAQFDNWVMLAVTVLFLIFAVTGARISRSEGALFVLGYAFYLGSLAATASSAGTF